jgi:RNA polymerase sigma factor (sigma-70 family)
MTPDPDAPPRHTGSDLHALPDHALLVAYGRSDPTASPVFVERFQRRVYGLALTILRDAPAAEDAAQEAFLRAWRHAEVFDARRGSVLTWLLTITRNTAIDSLRVRRPHAVDPDELVAWSPIARSGEPIDAVVLADDAERLGRAINRLPEAQRRAVVLAGMWGLSAREVAAIERIPLGTAKTRIRIALRRLRVMLVRGTREPERAAP